MNFASVTFEVFLRTFAHSLLSSILVLVLGLLGGMGLAGAHRFQKSLRLLCVLPALLPAIFIVTSILNVIRPFPFGIGAIVLVHALLNIGLVSVVVADLIQNHTQGFSDVCRVLGVKRSSYIFRVLIPSLGENLFRAGFTVFIFCFTSFSVPILIGGSPLNSIESLIYEKVRVEQNLQQALWLSAIQLGFLTVMNLIGQPRNRGAVEARPFMERGNLGSVAPFVFLPLVSCLLVFWGLAQGLVSGLQSGALKILLGPLYFVPVMEGLAGTVAIGIFCAFLIMIAASAVMMSLPQKQLQGGLRNLISPSPILLGVLFLLVLGWLRSRLSLLAADSAMWTALIEIPFIALCSALAFFPAFWRMSLEGAWERVQGQAEVAKLLGASRFLIFRRIVWPQVRPQISYVAGLASFWSIGDFALASLLSDRDISLGIVIQNLLGSYRIELASTLMWLLLFVGVVVMLLVWGLGYVQNQRD
jgi:thiamine transport system permease protein